MTSLILTFYYVFALIAIVVYLPRLNGFRYGFKKFPHKEARGKRRIALLIPARNESEIIGDLLSSIEAQDYDKSCFDTYVIVKEEADPTVELAKKFGASVTVVPNQHCKGEALDGFFKAHSAVEIASYDAFVIVDADGVLAPSYLKELNHALEYDSDIFVTRKIAKNFLGGRKNRSLFSNCSALTYPIVDDLGNSYRTKKGMPLNLCGQGLMVRRKVIEEIGGWPYRTMTEDYELKLDSLLRGFKSIYYPYAVLYTEEAISHHENFIRRTRWLTGYKQCDKQYKSRIKKQAKSRKQLSRGEVEYFFGLFPYFVFLIDTILTSVSGLALSTYYFLHGNNVWMSTLIILTLIPIAILYGLLQAFSLLALIVSHEAFETITKRECFAVLLFNPIYLLEYVCIYFVSLKQFHSKKSPVWKQTERVMRCNNEE